MVAGADDAVMQVRTHLPTTTALAVRTGDGWVLHGSAPLAVDVLPGVVRVPVTYEDEQCHERRGVAIVPLATSEVANGRGRGWVTVDGVRLGPDAVQPG